MSFWITFLILLIDGATFGLVTPPLLLEAGKSHPPWMVGVVLGGASAIGSMIQLRIFRWVLSGRHRWLTRLAPSRQKLEDAIGRYKNASFLGLVLVRATPIPDLPLKVVAAAGNYPIPRYGLAVWLGAIPYYYLLAKIGETFRPPLLLIGAGALAVVGIGVVERLLRRRRGAHR